jgi:CHAT domain-containing protein/tetratricopeptide (TPR) repeat protein
VGVPWFAETSPRREARWSATARQLSHRVLQPGARHDADLEGDRALVAVAVGQLDDAVVRLETAARQAPRKGWPLSDLAAVYLERARLRHQPLDVVLALSSAQRALAVEPHLLPARFNQAVAVERLCLRGEAVAAWQSYAAIEPDPLWSGEAQKHLATLAVLPEANNWPRARTALESAAERADVPLVRAAVKRYPQQARELAQEDLLGAWPGPVRSAHSDHEKSRRLSIARQIGAGLASVQGEYMVEDSVATIDGAWRKPPPPASPTALRTRLAAGHRAYGLAIALYRGHDFEAARAAFTRSHRALADAGSPLALWSQFDVGLCWYQQSHFRQALASLLPLLDDARLSRYPALRGRTLWVVGLIRGIQGELTRSLSTMSEALALFRGLKETANTAWLEAIITDNLDQLGATAEAWDSLAGALRDSAAAESPFAAFLTFEVAASLTRKAGYTEVAGLFENELVRSARQIGSPAAIAGALRGRAARTFAVAGKPDLALADLREARQQLATLTDRRARQAVEGDILLVEGTLGRQREPARAAVALSGAVRFYREAGDHLQLGRALAERALAYQAVGDDRRTENDLIAAVGEIERQRGRISGNEDRIAYFDQKKSTFDRLIEFHLDRRHRPDLAFDSSERARARSLLDWIVTSPAGAQGRSGSAVKNVTAGMVQRMMPAGTSLIELCVLHDRLLAWVIRRGELHFAATAVKESTVATLVQHLDEALREQRRNDYLASSSQLYDLLFGPVAPYLRPGEALVLAPDGPLQTLPFAVLRDGRRGRCLIEEHPLSVTPSAAVFVNGLTRDRQLGLRHAKSALFFGDPAFDREMHRDLPRLPAAALEAPALAKLFPDAAALVGEDATQRSFLSMAGGYRVVHFGGHALINPGFPLLSQLLFAVSPQDPDRGILFSGQVLRLRFPSTRLVVLAGCRTALGQLSSTEGALSLARPFLAAGVPAVVASLWKVDDQETADFFSRFYRHLKEGHGAAAALRASQLDSLASGLAAARDPATWGAYELFGASIGPLVTGTSLPLDGQAQADVAAAVVVDQ